MSTKNNAKAEPALTLDAEMSFWAMFKHIFAGAGNLSLNIIDGTNEFAGAFNNLGQASNAASRVVKDYALIEEAEAELLLEDKRKSIK